MVLVVLVVNYIFFALFFSLFLFVLVLLFRGYFPFEAQLGLLQILSFTSYTTTLCFAEAEIYPSRSVTVPFSSFYSVVVDLRFQNKLLF